MSDPGARGGQACPSTPPEPQEGDTTAMAMNSQANDAMIRRLEKELEERNNYAQVLIANVEE